MSCSYSVVPDDEELLHVVLDGEALPGESSRRFEPEATYQRRLATLILILKMKDALLYTHSQRVQQLTRRLTLALNLPKEEGTAIGLAAVFHDIGKITLPDVVLQKASSLTPGEFEIIKKHPVHGALILNQMGLPNEVTLVVYHHHEHWDGSGYPSGLRGEAIPLGARIVAIADAFDAMTSHRPYQTQRTPMEALKELRRCAGTQFDPGLVECFCNSTYAGETVSVQVSCGNRQLTVNVKLGELPIS
jgi:putative nucleotidyltransferase with HDIG domain